MANRVTIPVGNFESLSPPWSLASLDADLNALQGALNDSSLGYVITGTDSGSANNYIIATPAFGVPSAYQSGMSVAFIPAFTNTGNSTLTVAGLAPQAILSATNQVFPGAIATGNPVLVTYIGSAFQLISNNGGLALTTSTTAPGSTYTVNCRGAATVTVSVQWNSAITTTIALQNLPAGAPVVLTLTNSSGGSVIYNITGTDVHSASIFTFASFASSPAGATMSVMTNPQTLANGNTLVLMGMYNINTGNIIFIA